ncbi:hypothetical protein B0T26DRAFT_1616 [Lasiosphaeria miniovina]|uniref:Uncharacterized protein n=1 Tax=Lasiosphaeria miniovina TaxID=1954250 RepID=A0AA40BEZ2_9PEZI|nr:uncharacterized protein B0T26DRAFT_1616 [Lasiosphaeria miniovina]KAK0732969.1 hypothetical protein B0T26DRAFT_1616 [Lasiosphaeria miniovina]
MTRRSTVPAAYPFHHLPRFYLARSPVAPNPSTLSYMVAKIPTLYLRCAVRISNCYSWWYLSRWIFFSEVLHNHLLDVGWKIFHVLVLGNPMPQPHSRDVIGRSRSVVRTPQTRRGGGRGSPLNAGGQPTTGRRSQLLKRAAFRAPPAPSERRSDTTSLHHTLGRSRALPQTSPPVIRTWNENNHHPTSAPAHLGWPEQACCDIEASGL